MRPVVVSKSSLCPKVEKFVNGVWWKGISGVSGVLKCYRRARLIGGRALLPRCAGVAEPAGLGQTVTVPHARTAPFENY